MFQQAKEMVANMLNMDSDADADQSTDKQAAINAIQEAYQSASPEEQEELHQLEEELNRKM